MQNFKDLHYQNTPLLIGNVWDVASTKIAEQTNFKAIGTSSAAIASMLGYQDGEEMDFSELRYIVERISANTKLPLSVDLESGYSRDPLQITKHIKELAKIGVVGINLEDSIVEEKRTLLNAAEFAETIAVIKKQLKKEGIDIFLNIRTDTFLLGVSDRVKATQQRIALYEKAGADGIFVPCIEKVADISAIVKSTGLPINVMCMPNLPDFKTLQQLGVQRISMGNFVFEKNNAFFGELVKNIKEEETFESVFI